MIAIKSLQTQVFPEHLKTDTCYVVVQLPALNLRNDVDIVSCNVKGRKLTYDTETNEMVIGEELKAIPAIPFTKTELDVLMQQLGTNISTVQDFDAFQSQVLLFLAQRDKYYGLENWEIIV